MKILGSTCFDDFVAWYLQREQAKGRLPSVPTTPDERRALMESTHAGKLWPGCPAWSWSLVELDAADLPDLLILDCDWTRDESLVREGVVRTLDNAVTHALDSGYFINETEQRARHQAYYREYVKSSPSGQTLGTLVIRTLLYDEVSCTVMAGRSDISYYLHDGFGRLLPYLALSRLQQVKAIKLKAFLARP